VAWRPAPGAPADIPPQLYDDLAARGDSALLDEDERIVLDFVHRFGADHESIDDDLVDAVRRILGDGGLVELCACAARHLGFGRITRVLRLDQECPLPHAPSAPGP
jgi:hypothetical protein